MMKALLLKTSIIIFLGLVIILFSSCGEKLEGTFIIDGQAAKYKTDTSINTFKMIDSHGITEEFHKNKGWYSIHSYFNEWGENAFYETFGIAYNSVINNYFFMFVMRANEESVQMEFEWNYYDRFTYDFETHDLMINGGAGAKIAFYDTLRVNDILYHDIIELDYTLSSYKTDKNTPLRIWMAGKEGLIKIERKDGIFSERIN